MQATLSLTHHAAYRARTRSIPAEALDAAMTFGRHRAVRNADIYTLGWREVRALAARGIDVARWEGVEVVCSHDGDVLTTYRNTNARALRRPYGVRRAA
ncbi:MAG: DUF4258 domain-containing protein [Deltaproteobacteria bacterium]|nr:MAG: DUF4258 domain-containing protein [Deltaproteobacteria bacterium]